MGNDFSPLYFTISCASLNEQQIQDCSDLYSSDYGTWSGIDNSVKKGKKIKLGPQWYSNLKSQKDMNVSLCYDGDKQGNRQETVTFGMGYVRLFCLGISYDQCCNN